MLLRTRVPGSSIDGQFVFIEDLLASILGPSKSRRCREVKPDEQLKATTRLSRLEGI
jgi:hypothetical protein